MTEYKLFTGDVPEVSTFEFHEHRERAPHLEQGIHQGRLAQAAAFVETALDRPRTKLLTISDLGCGDGGLLSVVQDFSGVEGAWGYDFAPANIPGWTERGVMAYAKDAFVKDRDEVVYGDISIATEVLEHVADPHGVVKRVSTQSQYMVASSPWTETDQSHDECHAWAWDMEGYAALFTNNGWTVLDHVTNDMFQIILVEAK